MEEEWKDLDCTKKYEISNLGRLRRALTKEEKKLKRYNTDYFFIRFGMPLHQEVARLFIEPRKRGFVVHHLNRDKLDNRVDNLVYIKDSEHRQLDEFKDRPKKNNAKIGEKQEINAFTLLCIESVILNMPKEVRKRIKRRLVKER